MKMPRTLCCRKWKTKTTLMDSIPDVYKNEFAEVLEQAAKDLLHKQNGRYNAPNIWPEIIRKFKMEKNIPE